MKLSFFCTAFVLAVALIAGPKFSLEAKHRNYFSLNFGPAFAYPPPAVVVQPSYPTIVEQRYYVDPYGYPSYNTVYVQPAPRAYYVYPPRPAFYSGFSFGVGLR